MIHPDRAAVEVDAARAAGHLVAELLGGDLPIMLVADVARVVVLITATVGERDDVVDDGRSPGLAFGEAQLAQAVGAAEAALALALASPTAEPLDH